MHTISEATKDRNNKGNHFAPVGNAPNTTQHRSAKLPKKTSMRPKNLKEALLDENNAVRYEPNVIDVAGRAKASTVSIPPTKRQRLSLS